MPITQMSTYVKHSFNYTSPDGEQYDIVFCKNDDHKNERKYVQFNKTDSKSEPITIDWEMWSEIYLEIDKIINPQGQVKKTSGKGLKAPTVTDRRNEDIPTAAANIDKSVAESLKRQDDNVRPIETFRPAIADGFNYDVERSGVNPDALGSVAETPPDLRPDEQLKRDIENRGRKVTPSDLI